jgi:hypothetical protein
MAHHASFNLFAGKLRKETTAARLDALFLAILDKAFNGEL